MLAACAEWGLSVFGFFCLFVLCVCVCVLWGMFLVSSIFELSNSFLFHISCFNFVKDRIDTHCLINTKCLMDMRSLLKQQTSLNIFELHSMMRTCNQSRCMHLQK